MKSFFIFVICCSSACFGQQDTGFVPFSHAHTVHFDTAFIHPGFMFINSLHDDNYYKECVGPDTLDDGSIICYGQDPEFNRYLFLLKEDSLQVLYKAKATSFWHVGRLQAEYKNSFMIIHDQGNGCPPSYELFSKRTGKNMMGAGKQFDDYLWADHVLYLIYLDRKKDKIVLFNVTTRGAEYYELPAGFPEAAALNFESLDASELVIRYSDFLHADDERTNKYSRAQP